MSSTEGQSVPPLKTLLQGKIGKGLLLETGRFFSCVSYNEYLRVALQRAHPEDLSRENIEERLVELLNSCHNNRSLMVTSGRMTDSFWHAVRESVPWTQPMTHYVIRELVLGLTRAAYKWMQREKQAGRPLNPGCTGEIAVAALVFINDIRVYEAEWGDLAGHMGVIRAPAYHESADGTLIRTAGGIPVFPITRGTSNPEYTARLAAVTAGGWGAVTAETYEDQNIIDAEEQAQP